MQVWSPHNLHSFCASSCDPPAPWFYLDTHHEKYLPTSATAHPIKNSVKKNVWVINQSHWIFISLSLGLRDTMHSRNRLFRFSLYLYWLVSWTISWYVKLDNTGIHGNIPIHNWWWWQLTNCCIDLKHLTNIVRMSVESADGSRLLHGAIEGCRFVLSHGTSTVNKSTKSVQGQDYFNYENKGIGIRLLPYTIKERNSQAPTSTY